MCEIFLKFYLLHRYSVEEDKPLYSVQVQKYKIYLLKRNNYNKSNDDDFISPIHKLTKNELREELKLFREDNNSSRNNINNTLLNHNNDNYDADDIEFHTYQSTKCSICCYQY
ncbi:unnamed protein product [Rotaria sordida]|uniref:Uncharacterized protein n=1 Tax=Rotaria sordida TaxID=392033 RepID=A0A813WFW8_9BILA|nr:unnamed protein product [Rotaria sordida]